MCFRAGLEIHSKAGSQRALWVTEMERTEREHKEKREWKLSPHSPLSFSFSPSLSQFPTHLCSVKHIRVSTGLTDGWLKSLDVSGHFPSGNLGDMWPLVQWPDFAVRLATCQLGYLWNGYVCFLGCLDVCGWIEISHVWSLQTSFSLKSISNHGREKISTLQQF